MDCVWFVYRKMELRYWLVPGNAESNRINREVNDVYGKRQTAKMKLLPSVFRSLCSKIKISVFAVNSKRHFSIFV